MAEEKKTLKLQRLADKSLTEYVEALGSAGGKPAVASAAALTAALAVNLGALAGASAEEGRLDPNVTKELSEMGKYMLKQVDETVRSRAPLLRRLAEGAETEQIESAARVACGIPNEIVYMMCRAIELLDQIADVCSDDQASNVLGAVHLALGLIAAMRGEIKAVSRHMMEFTFRYTVNREAELNVQNHQELIDALIAKLTARLDRQLP